MAPLHGRARGRGGEPYGGSRIARAAAPPSASAPSHNACGQAQRSMACAGRRCRNALVTRSTTQRAARQPSGRLDADRRACARRRGDFDAMHWIAEQLGTSQHGGGANSSSTMERAAEVAPITDDIFVLRRRAREVHGAAICPKAHGGGSRCSGEGRRTGGGARAATHRRVVAAAAAPNGHRVAALYGPASLCLASRDAARRRSCETGSSSRARRILGA